MALEGKFFFLLHFVLFPPSFSLQKHKQFYVYKILSSWLMIHFNHKNRCLESNTICLIHWKLFFVKNLTKNFKKNWKTFLIHFLLYAIFNLSKKNYSKLSWERRTWCGINEITTVVCLMRRSIMLHQKSWNLAKIRLFVDEDTQWISRVP